CKAPVEAASPQGNVGAEEGEAGDRQPGGSQEVATGQRPEGGEQALHRHLRLPARRRLAAQKDLRLEYLAAVAQLRVDRLHCPAPLDLLVGVGAAAAVRLAAQQIR